MPLQRTKTTAYRVINAEADHLPGVAADWFDGVAVVSLYDSPRLPAEKEMVSAVQEALHPVAIYLKRRPREAATITDAEREARAPDSPVSGAPIPERVVLENGLRYLIRPGQGLAVGLYLDMRDARNWVRLQAESKRVLNCFAYTCGFSVAARAGRAERVVNVDLSRKSLDWGEENARLNGQKAERRDFISGDVFDWLARFRKKGELFDTVILDPPSFATTRAGAFSAASDWSRLIEQACGALRPSGLLLACCNLSSLSEERFQRLAERGFAQASRRANLRQPLFPSRIDFPAPPGKTAPLKILAYEVR